jgi:hypothetical protein
MKKGNRGVVLVLERTNSPIFVTLFNNAVSVALFKYDKELSVVAAVTLLTMVTVFKQWMQIWGSLLHKYVSTIIREWHGYHSYQL